MSPNAARKGNALWKLGIGRKAIITRHTTMSSCYIIRHASHARSSQNGPTTNCHINGKPLDSTEQNQVMIMRNTEIPYTTITEFHPYILLDLDFASFPTRILTIHLVYYSCPPSAFDRHVQWHPAPDGGFRSSLDAPKHGGVTGIDVRQTSAPYDIRNLKILFNSRIYHSFSENWNDLQKLKKIKTKLKIIKISKYFIMYLRNMFKIQQS